MAFYVYRSNDLERLTLELAGVVREPSAPVDPLRPETVVVQSRALERWLGQRLAHTLGAWACPDFPFPRKVIDEAFAAVLGDADLVATSVFTEARLQWAIARVLPECLAEDAEAFAPIRRYLAGAEREPASRPEAGEGNPPDRLFALSAQIATLFDRYALYRPDWVLRWDRAPEPHWQSRLWHRLGRTFGGSASAPVATHLAARAQACEAALRSLGERPAGLPPRLHLFGIRTLPPLFLRIFAVLAEVLDVHLYHLSPCAEYWGDVRREDASVGEGLANPLLASLGRLGRDFQALLEEHGGHYHEVGAWYVDPTGPPATEAPGDGDAAGGRAAAAPSALAVVQADVLHLRHRRSGGGEGAEPLPLLPGDRSLAVHACFSPMREVEALRDQLLALFEELPGLQPRDVVVMAPDMDVYAPYVEAVFDVPPDAPTWLPFSVTDRRPRVEHDVVDAFLALLELLPTRLTAPEVLELLAQAPVRERFGIPLEGLETIAGWLGTAGVRWGVDAADREALGQPPYHEYTWRFGLDRLLLGYAVAGDGWTTFAGVLPVEELDGDPSLLGSLVDFSEALFAARKEAASPVPPAEWRTRLRRWLDGLVEGEGPRAWQHQLLREAVEELTADAAVAGFTGPLELAAVRALLEARVNQPAPPREFLSGGITFCALRPMRSVPFRVVALLGLGDDQFPRRDRRPAFDRLMQEPRPGDRSVREDDRYQFLEALLAARERLLIFYVGQDVRDQSQRPPSVVVSELLDVLGDAFDVVDGAPADAAAEAGAGAQPRETPEARHRRLRRRLVSHHPLHPFDQRYFGSEPADGAEGPWFSYAEQHLRAARALAGPRQEPPSFLEAPLPAPASALPGSPAGEAARPGGHGEPEPVGLDALERFWALPCRDLLLQRLGLGTLEEETRLEAREPIDLGGLRAWSVREALLERHRVQASLGGAAEAFAAAALLPLGALGRSHLETQVAQVAPLAARLAPYWAEEPLPPQAVDLALDLGPGAGPVRLAGWLRGLRGGAQLYVRAGHLRAAHQLRAWIRHLALSALGREGLPGPTLLAGLAPPDGAPALYHYPRIPEAVARGHLAELVALFQIGQQVPLRFFPEASLVVEAYAAEGPDRALGRARSQFLKQGQRGELLGEAADPAVARLFPSAEHLAAPAGPGPDGGLEEGLSFTALARRVLGPLLEARREGLP